MRNAVIATTRDLVVENGADQLRMTTVLKTTGIARGTLYNTVRNKDELLVALVVDSIEVLADSVVARGDADLVISLNALGGLLKRDGLVVSLRESATKDVRNISWCLSEAVAQVGRAGVARVLAATGLAPDGLADPRVELVFRWALTQAGAPLDGEDLFKSVLLLAKACQ